MDKVLSVEWLKREDTTDGDFDGVRKASVLLVTFNDGEEDVGGDVSPHWVGRVDCRTRPKWKQIGDEVEVIVRHLARCIPAHGKFGTYRFKICEVNGLFALKDYAGGAT